LRAMAEALLPIQAISGNASDVTTVSPETVRSSKNASDAVWKDAMAEN